MKQLLITLTMVLVLGLTTEAVAQKHRHTPQPQQKEQTELIDSTSTNGVEAFSDTTSTSATPTAADDNFPFDDEDDFVRTPIDSFFDHVGLMQTGIAGMFFVLIVLLIVFVLSPLLIIIAVFYFINKNRKDKMRLAQMAMQQGQPIPDQLLKEQLVPDDEEYKSGIRQCFVGVGLMIFLWFAAGAVGFGIGALVFCIGLGKVIVARMTGKKQENKEVF